VIALNVIIFGVFFAYATELKCQTFDSNSAVDWWFGLHPNGRGMGDKPKDFFFYYPGSKEFDYYPNPAGADNNLENLFDLHVQHANKENNGIISILEKKRLRLDDIKEKEWTTLDEPELLGKIKVLHLWFNDQVKNSASIPPEEVGNKMVKPIDPAKYGFKYAHSKVTIKICVNTSLTNISFWFQLS
jgi:hypothetical protein